MSDFYVPGQFREANAYLVGVSIKREHDSLWSVEDSLAELTRLAETAGLKVLGQITQSLDNYVPATYIGSGKVEEVKAAVDELNVGTVIFDDELSPGQQRNLEKLFGENVKVLDRTALILDIFAQHAATKEGQLQVELAQYEYRLPRLTRMWTHLARQAGGGAARGGASGVGLRGPGETQLEVDRREINSKIAHIKRSLEDVRRHRDQYRQRRERTGVPVVAIVGYTNAGKSTLLNALSGANVLAENKLFATLDPTTRKVELPEGREILFTDTVGFIQKLPTHLVAAFRATLEEIASADLLLHVVDIAHPMADAQIEAVEEVLESLKLSDKPILMAWNKADLLTDEQCALYQEETTRYGDSILVSAETGQNIPELLSKIEEVLRRQMVKIEARIPYNHGELLNLVHEYGEIEVETHEAEGTYVRAFVPQRVAGQLGEYVKI
ncbi:MAG: GTPase HflX [Ardenticatenales bacterium]|nr:GTPase HflX [Ardenticatenales bacterium]